MGLDENHCQDCGGLGIPPATTNCHKVMCDKCEGLGVLKLEHLLHQNCIDILEKQKAYLSKDNAASGSIRRVETRIRREEDRKKELHRYFPDGRSGCPVTINGRLPTTDILSGIQGKVTRCHNAPNQQYEVKIDAGADEEQLKRFYKSENAKYVTANGTHYVYVQREELEAARRRRLPENYDALRPADQALVRRRLMNRQTSHIVVLERLLDDINEINP